MESSLEFQYKYKCVDCGSDTGLGKYLLNAGVYLTLCDDCAGEREDEE